MPAQPACFHRLDEILALLWGFDTGYLDRQVPSDGDTRCGEVAGGRFPETITLGPEELRIVFDGGYWTWRPRCWSCPRR